MLPEKEIVLYVKDGEVIRTESYSAKLMAESLRSHGFLAIDVTKVKLPPMKPTSELPTFLRGQNLEI